MLWVYAQASESAATQAMTDQLLAQLTLQVAVGFKGPAFIAGDFNQLPGVLAEPLRWEAMGWMKYNLGPMKCLGSVRDPRVVRSAGKTLSISLHSCRHCCDHASFQTTRHFWAFCSGPQMPHPFRVGLSPRTSIIASLRQLKLPVFLVPRRISTLIPLPSIAPSANSLNIMFPRFVWPNTCQVV